MLAQQAEKQEARGRSGDKAGNDELGGFLAARQDFVQGRDSRQDKVDPGNGEHSAEYDEDTGQNRIGGCFLSHGKARLRPRG